MSWFNKHLNWTFFLGSLLSWGLGWGIGNTYIIFNPYAPEGIYYLVYWLVTTACAFVIGKWYLKHKNRSLGYLLWMPFILSGWVLLGLLCMKNKTEEVANETIQ